MSLIIEDGSIVANSNSYITEAEYDAYLALHGYPHAEATDDLTAVEVHEALLIRAYEFQCLLPWCVDQSVAYTVTDAHKNSQAEIAYRFYSGLDPFEVKEVDIQKERIDSNIEISYFGKSAGGLNNSLRSIPYAYELLKGLLCFSSRRLIRS